MLSLYNPLRETELHCDASSLGFGAVLLQRAEDKRFHPVSFYSKSTSKHEGKFHSFELETLAIIYALRRFRVYLEGIPFKIVTDCHALKWTLERKSLNPRIARWALELQNYEYEVEHRKGESMTHADALSRCYAIVPSDRQEVESRIRITQVRDPEIQSMVEKLSEGSVEGYNSVEGLVVKIDDSGRRLFWVPAEMQNNVIRLVHEKLAHQGVDKCCSKLLKRYWFPRMRSKVDLFIKNCLQCLMYSAPVRNNERNLYMIPKLPIPFDTLHIDHFGPLPSVISKRKHLLVVVDAFTKFVKLYPSNGTSTKEVLCTLDKYFEYYSRPRRIVSDRGTCFTSAAFAE